MSAAEYKTPLKLEVYTRPSSYTELGFPVNLYSLTDAEGKLIGAAPHGHSIIFDFNADTGPDQPTSWEFCLCGGMMTLKGLKHEDMIPLTRETKYMDSVHESYQKLARKPGDELRATTEIFHGAFCRETP